MDSDLESVSSQSSTLFDLPLSVATAAAEGHVESVRYWLEGPHDSDDEDQRDVNAEDENGWTLLLHACEHQHDDEYKSRDDEAYVDLVRYLITQGANVG